MGTATDLLKWAHTLRAGRVLSQAARDELGRGHVFVRREGTSDVNSSCWVRVASFWAGKQWGAIHIPRIGQEVLVDFWFDHFNVDARKGPVRFMVTE